MSEESIEKKKEKLFRLIEEDEKQMLRVVRAEETPVDKLNRIFKIASANKAKYPGAFREIYYGPGARPAYKEVEEKVAERIGPIIAEVIEEGVKEKVFDTIDPGEAASLVLSTSDLARQRIRRIIDESGSAGDVEKEAVKLEKTVADILKAEPGDICLVDRELVKKLFGRR